MSDPQQLTIYQTFHKDYVRNADCPWIQPVGVNGYQAEGFRSDGEGDDNISSLNSFYCELTAQYWVWKNATADVVGFYHYRRYLNYVFDATWQYQTTVGVPGDASFLSYLTADGQRSKLGEILDVTDAIVPKRAGSNRSIEAHYLAHHPAETWHAFMEELHDQHPGYRKFMPLFKLNSTMSNCNMVVIRREMFNDYCEELFPLIDAVYARIGAPYDSYNNRYPGFLAERFLGFWLHARGLRTFEVPLILLT